MEAGRCDGYTDDTGSLAGMRSTLKAPAEWMVLPELISKEPLGLHIRSGDARWHKGDFGKMLGLDNEWMYRAIKISGNYGEMYDTHWGPKALDLPRAMNNLYNKGGMHYTLPLR